MSLDEFWIICDDFAQSCGRHLQYFWGKFSNKAELTKATIKPVLNSTYQASLALYAFYTTSQVCISILPLVLSSITLFSALPLLSSFSTEFIYLSVIGISVVAGYFKYNDLLHRDKLDKQVIINKKENKQLAKKLKFLQDKLDAQQLHSEIKVPAKTKLYRQRHQRHQETSLPSLTEEKSHPKKKPNPKPSRR